MTVILFCNLVCVYIRYVGSSLAVVVFFKIARDRFCSGEHEGKYSSDIHLYSCELSNRIARKYSNIRNFAYESNIHPILTA